MSEDGLGFELRHDNGEKVILGHGCLLLAEAREYVERFASLDFSLVITDQALCDANTKKYAARLAQRAAIKPWPANNKTVDFEDLCDPIIKAVRFAYKLTRRNIDKDIPYRGYDTESSNHVVASLAERFTAENLEWRLGDQGKDALHEIICAAVQLGIEQGQRLAKENLEMKRLILQARLLRDGPEDGDEDLVSLLLD